MEFSSGGTLGMQIMTLNLLRRNLTHKKIAQYGCELQRGQLPVLEVIVKHPGITQAEAASMLMVTPASIALSTKRLQKSGFIEKTTDPENRRCNLLKATPSGEQATKDACRCFDEVDAVSFAGFTDEELNAYRTMTQRMIRNLYPEMTYPAQFPLFKEEHKTC